MKKNNTVIINGVAYNPKFNFNVLAQFCDQNSISLNEISKLQDLSLSQLFDLCWFGLKEGCRIQGKECPFSSHDIGTFSTDTIKELIESVCYEIIAMGANTNYKA